MPLYWEIKPDYKVVTNEVELYALNLLNVKTVSKDVTHNVTYKVHYELNNITGKQTYNGSNVTVMYLWVLRRGNSSDTITIINNLVNLAFTFNAISKAVSKLESTISPLEKNYNGNGTAVINGMMVNFTKVPKETHRDLYRGKMLPHSNWLRLTSFCPMK
jgi:hypothetical protein